MSDTLEWLNQKAAIEDKNTVSVGGLVTRLETLPCDQLDRELAEAERHLTSLSIKFRELGRTIVVNTHDGVIEWNNPRYPAKTPKLRTETLEQWKKRWR